MASTASFRIADMRTMMDDDPSLRSSSENPPGAYGGLGETGARLGVIPREELIERHVINATSDG